MKFLPFVKRIAENGQNLNLFMLLKHVYQCYRLYTKPKNYK